MPELPITPMHRIAKRAGAERVSMKAAKELSIVLEEIGLEISRQALAYMMHSRRKTLLPEDIKFAARNYRSRRRYQRRESSG